jgi:hypothetical protein
MSGKRPGLGQLVTGAGGVLLLVSLFLPWAEAGGVRQDGFQLLSGGDLFLSIVGLVAIATAFTWGRYGLFRPDMSMNGATDLLGLTATIVLIWTIFFDLPSGAETEVGAFLSLIASLAITCGAGDYSTLRGASWFPRIGDNARRE